MLISEEQTCMLYKLVRYILNIVFLFRTLLQNAIESDQLVLLRICIQEGGIPINGQQYVECAPEYQLDLLEPDSPQQMYIPYPVSGPWIIATTPLCFPPNTTRDRYHVRRASDH